MSPTALFIVLASAPQDSVPPRGPRAPDPGVRSVTAPTPAEDRADRDSRTSTSPGSEARPTDAKAADDASAVGARPRRRRPLIGTGPATRQPAGSRGGSFFDPGKLEGATPLAPLVTLRGYVGASFVVTERTNTRARTDDGEFEELDPLPFFGAGTATLYVSTPVYADVVHARISLDYLSIPTPIAGTNDIVAPANRSLLLESAALEVNPFAWAERTPTWFRYGFKITAGAFIVPFGIEDENHPAPVNWFTTRPNAMTTNRIYPGTWTDVGLGVKWKPTFAERGIRPIELDVGFVNGDPCTQTRFTDWLYRPGRASAVEVCERIRRTDETPDIGGSKIDVGFLGIAPDNNANKSVFTRIQLFPVAPINLGGSFVWGKHPAGDQRPDAAAGETIVEVAQLPTWRAGAHAEVDFDALFDTRMPLPTMRGELVIGTDEAAKESRTLADREMIGGYAEFAQPLFRRPRFKLPGLIVQYRFDHSDPDRAVPGHVDGRSLRSDFSDGFRYDEAIQAHTIGLRLPVVPRFTLKAGYTFQLEDGGRENQLANDFLSIQAVGDF